NQLRDVLQGCGTTATPVADRPHMKAPPAPDPASSRSEHRDREEERRGAETASGEVQEGGGWGRGRVRASGLLGRRPTPSVVRSPVVLGGGRRAGSRTDGREWLKIEGRWNARTT